MEKLLEKAYKEEYVRSKARYDYEQYLSEKRAQKKKKEQYLKATEHIIWGIASLYLLYRIYLIF